MRVKLNLGVVSVSFCGLGEEESVEKERAKNEGGKQAVLRHGKLWLVIAMSSMDQESRCQAG